jgi:ubiquinone/menaquinone biosynthesis C-methylase UbiE
MENENHQIEYWDKVSNEKKFTTHLDFNIINKYLNKNSLIVDYGCGYGRTLKQLYDVGYPKLIGFDYSSGMIERGKRSFSELDLRVSTNNSITCESNIVDAVILFAVLTCIIDDNQQIKLIEEIKRVLKPGGIIYINDFLTNNDERNTSRYTKFMSKYSTYGVFELDEGAILRHHSAEWINKLVSDFEKEEYKEIIFRTMNGHTSNGFVFIGSKKK